VVERKNRSLEELGRTMLSESSLPKYFWADAVSTSCYVMNKVNSSMEGSLTSIISEFLAAVVSFSTIERKTWGSLMRKRILASS